MLLNANLGSTRVKGNLGCYLRGKKKRAAAGVRTGGLAVGGYFFFCQLQSGERQLCEVSGVLSRWRYFEGLERISGSLGEELQRGSFRELRETFLRSKLDSREF